MCTIGNLATLASATGSDPTGLGRWNWMQFEGNNFLTLVLAACKSIRSTTTVGTVCLKQKRHYRRRNIERCPRKLLIEDFIEFSGTKIG